MFFSLADLRRATQFVWLLLCNSYVSAFINHQNYKGPLKCTCLPVLSCHACPSATFSCPIGTIQYYVALHQIPFFVLGHLGLICLFVGRMACGWLCPFGLVQDLLYRVKSVELRLPRWLALGPYVSLGLLVILLPLLTSENWFSKLCPWGTITAGLPWVLWNPTNPATGAPMIAPGAVGPLFVVKVIILLVFLAFFVVHKRPFCRYACPLGLLLSWFNRVSLLRMEVQASCNHCDTCQTICPVDFKVYEDPNSGQCIRCLNCLACTKVKVDVPLLRSRTGDAGDSIASSAAESQDGEAK